MKMSAEDRAKIEAALKLIDVDVDSARPPCEQHGRRASGEVDAAGRTRARRKVAHEAVQAFGVYGLTHSAARSKLTSRRMSALYCE